MRLFLLIFATMCAFAANSLLTRAGVFVAGMDAMAFSGVRLASGAVMLGALVMVRGGVLRPATGWGDVRGWTGALWLLAYLLPFSLAYLTLPSGVGALVLFGVVQMTMFAGAALGGRQPRGREWLGMGVAMAGLVWLLWPSGGVVFAPSGVVFMALAGVAWGLFSLKGRGSSDPLGDMARSFVLLLPIALVFMALGSGFSPAGVALAILCGAVTSGLGYALWYLVLPQIEATIAAVAQLSVPVIALIAGALFLSEALSVQVVLAAAIVLGGIAVAVVQKPRR